MKLRGISVLVVEDDGDTRDTLRMILESQGAAVTSASAASEALVAVKRSPPDAVVSDIGMPHENGHSFLRELRALKPELGGRIPAIALTADSSRESRLESRDSGFHYHLEKPIDPTKLVDLLVDLVRLTRR
jgi:CheY-like chemotaxis protein